MIETQGPRPRRHPETVGSQSDEQPIAGTVPATVGAAERTMAKLVMAALGATMALTGAARAAEPMAVTPMAAFVHAIGSKQVVGYYLAEADACRVTMMVAEAPAEDAATLSAARVQVTLSPMTGATIESAEGRKLVVTCAAGADSLLVDARPAGPRLASR
jgi:hypothetical protein